LPISAGAKHNLRTEAVLFGVVRVEGSVNVVEKSVVDTAPKASLGVVVEVAAPLGPLEQEGARKRWSVDLIVVKLVVPPRS
jgi:hypothetical protein